MQMWSPTGWLVHPYTWTCKNDDEAIFGRKHRSAGLATFTTCPSSWSVGHEKLRAAYEGRFDRDREKNIANPCSEKSNLWERVRKKGGETEKEEKLLSVILWQRKWDYQSRATKSVEKKRGFKYDVFFCLFVCLYSYNQSCSSACC